MFATDTVAVSDEDQVILALPPAGVVALLPDITVPDASRAIINAHFVLPEPRELNGCLGLVGGHSHWLFVRGDVASVTISAADRLLGESPDELCAIIWSEVAKVLDINADAPVASRLVIEKRATFAQTPAQLEKRPPARTDWNNLFLAGDWTNTGLPATIEGALRSGKVASELIHK